MIKNPWVFPGIMGIDDAVCHVWGISPSMLKLRTRKREIAEARQVAMWWRIRNTGDSLSRIAKEYNLDHCTALYAREHVKELMTCDRHFKDRVDTVEKMMITINIK